MNDIAGTLGRRDGIVFKGARAASLPIRVEAVSKRYGAVTALDSVSLDIAAGEFVTLLGPSGSGKTTVLNIIAGFTRLDRGRLFFGEQDVTLLPPHKRDLGLVFQNYALFPHMNVAANVAFPLRARKYPKHEISARVQWALDLVKLGDLADRAVDQLSGGQRQRVALARAVVFKPKIILMDEPLSALDKQLREHMQIELRHLHAELGSTTVYVTHDQREALTMSDRIAVLNHGRLVQVDTPQKLYEQPADRFVAEFVGESALIPVARNGAQSVLLGDIELRANRPLPSGDALLLAVRSEKLVLAAESNQPVNRLEGTVQEIIYQGDSVLVFAELPSGARVAMRRPARHDTVAQLPPAGSPITFGLSPEHTVVVPAE